jgi:hypothetical protein
MLSSHYSGDTVSYSSSSSRLDRIASWSNVDRAYWEKLEFPTKTVVLADHVSLEGFDALKEGYIRELTKLKIDFVPSSDDPEWGSIVVRASKTRVHGISTGIFSRVYANLLRFFLQDSYIVECRAETSIGNAHPYREPDAHLLLHTAENLTCIIAVLESAYSETATVSQEEFEDELRWYFENNDEINLVIGSYVTYIPPSHELPDQLPMTLIPFSLSEFPLDKMRIMISRSNSS